jgi:transcription antitermination factor NusG
MVKEEVRPVLPVVVPAGRSSGKVQRRRFEQPELPDLRVIIERTWYLVQVPSGRETLVADLMRSRHHEAIVPVVRCWRRPNRHTHTKREREFTLMARYVILGFDPLGMSGFDDLRRYSFVHTVVSDANGYETIARAQLIEFVKLLGTSTWTVDQAQRFMRTGREFAVGDRVEVLDGSLAGWIVTVKAIEGGTAYFDVPLFNRLTTFRMPLEVLGKAA